MASIHKMQHRLRKDVSELLVYNEFVNLEIKAHIPKIVFIVLYFASWFYPVSGGSITLDSNNFDLSASQNEVLFINFYADWCRFSQILGPVFDEAADKIAAEYPGPGRVLFGKLDCDKEGDLASRYHISKYPTLKLFKNGRLAKKEYRGQRSVDAFITFIREQLADPVVELKSLEDLQNVNDKRIIVAYFDEKVSPHYDVFRKVASNLKEECTFYIGVGDVSASERVGGNSVFFRLGKNKDGSQDTVYMGPLDNFDVLNQWAIDKCLPLVREITFENAEELTEEGLPFLILFHHPDDSASADLYSQEVAKQLIDEKNTMNFLTADGLKFSHPLFHLGKTEKDLPLIAIDSFRHMYLFPGFQEIRDHGKLKQFVLDLHSGKLHREFHHGPDPTLEQSTEQGDSRVPGPNTQPPESIFKKLAPSRTRYTVLRDEL